MIREGISGGLLNASSFLNHNDQKQSTYNGLRIASAGWREAAKEGMLSLYADPSEVLEKYKDTPVVKSMNDRKDAKLLWVRARAIDADTVNANGDFFSTEEILKERDYQGNKMPAYKSFEGVPIYANHKNGNIEEAKGMVVYAEWDPKDKAVYVVFFVDEEAYPDIARGIRIGYIHDVSMGCFPPGTTVLTNLGHLKIENITIDNQLIDATGKLTPIKNTQIKEYNDDLFTLTIEGGTKTTATREHPYLVIKAQDWESRRKRIGSGKNRYYQNNDLIQPQYIRMDELCVGDRVLSPIGGSEIAIPNLTPNKARIAGYFLAEGSYIKRNGKFVEAQFNFALDEENTLASETIALVKSEFNLVARKCIRKDKNLCIISVSENEFVNWLLNYVGEYSHGKELRHDLMFAPIEIQKHLIGAWISGDGYLHRIPSQPNADMLSACTVSRKLALQMSYLFNRLGIACVKRGSFNKKSLNFTDAIEIPEKAIDVNGRQVAYYFDIPSGYSSIIGPYTVFNGIYNTRLKLNDWNGYIARPIKKIETKPYNGLVFNFETKTHSYVVGDLATHNCQVEYGICSECRKKARTEKDYCFVPSTLITMSDGTLKPICNVQVGDEVISHSGCSRKVLSTFRRQVEEELVEIKSPGLFDSLLSTRNHPIYSAALNKIQCVRDARRYCHAEKLGVCWSQQKPGLGKLTCNHQISDNAFEFVQVNDLAIGDFVHNITVFGHNDKSQIGVDMAKFVGYYMAEGCTPIGKNHVEFSFNENESNTIIRDAIVLSEKISEKFPSKYVPHVYSRKNSKGVLLRWTNPALVTWLNENCHGHAHNKQFSKKFIESLSHSESVALLSAFIDGDGCQSVNKTIQMRTASQNLANQIIMICHGIGIRPNTGKQLQNCGPTNRDKKNYIYYINITGRDSDIFFNNTYKVKQIAACFKQNHRQISDELGFATPITSLEKVAYKGDVCNIEVDIDNSYIANGIAVHNCDHMKTYKGKPMPGKSKSKDDGKAYEENYDLKFIELSVVGDGAFENCTIEEIYDVEDVLQKALVIEKRAQSILSGISLAATMVPQDANERKSFENALRQASSTVSTTLRVATIGKQINENLTDAVKTIIAQTAGTLVGGQLLSGEGANNNTTVGNILQFLGIDARSGLNILDMLNLALNFLEVAVMNLFARKDNIDLTHVGKITKAMADLQATMSDMIDDGVDTGGGAGKNTPMNQGQLQQQQPGGQAPQAPQAPGGGQQQQQTDFINLPGGVGRSVSPMFMSGNGPGGISGISNMGTASNTTTQTKTAAKRPFFVWAGDDEDDEPVRAVFASVNNSSYAAQDYPEPSRAPSLRLFNSLAALADTLGLEPPTTANSKFEAAQDRVSVAGGTQPVKVETKQSQSNASSTETYSGVPQMANEFINPLKRIVAQHRRRKAGKVSVDLKVNDEEGNQIVLSSADGSITAYHKGQRVAWYQPTLSEDKLNALEGEDAESVVQDILSDFGKEVAARVSGGREVVAEWKPNNHTPDSGYVGVENRIKDKRTNNPDDDGKIREETLKDGGEAGQYSRKGFDNVVREKSLEGDYLSDRRPTDQCVKENLLDADAEAGLYGRRNDDDALGTVRENLLADARHGYPGEVIEKQLDNVRKPYGPGDPNLIIEATIKALARAVVAARVAPEEILTAARRLSERSDLAELVKLAELGSGHRTTLARRFAFHNENPTLTPVSAILNEIGQCSTDNLTANLLADGLVIAATEIGHSVRSVTAMAKSLLGNDHLTEYASMSNGEASPRDRMRAALAALSAKTDDDGLVILDNLRAALSAMAMSAQEVQALPKDVVASVANTDANTLLGEVEIARTAEAFKQRTEKRETRQKRAQLYGAVRMASKSDIHDSVVGMLADYASAYEMTSPAIVAAAVKAIEQPVVAEQLITRMVEAALNKDAASVTEEHTIRRTVNCTIDDLGGLDPKSPDFEQQVPAKIAEILSRVGIQSDPNTDQFNVLSISDNSVTATAEVRVTKTFNADTSTAPPVSSIDAGAAPGVTPGVDGDTTGGDQTPDVVDDGQNVSTAAARKLRQAKRDAIIARYAQAAPGMGGAGMGAGGGMGGGGGMDLTGGAAGAGAADGLGMSALTVPTAAGGNPPEGEDDVDGMTEPGKKRQWGETCPRCGSDEVDLANGEGNCKACGTQYTVEFLIKEKPSNKNDDNDTDEGAPPPGGPELGGDMGLGAATAPGAGAPPPGGGAPPMGGGAPPMGGGAPPPGGGPMASAKDTVVRTAASNDDCTIFGRLSWREDADVFVRHARAASELRMAQTLGTVDASLTVADLIRELPVGFVCPSCGNRNASKVKSHTFCYDCGAYSKTEVREARDAKGKLIPGKVDVSILAPIH